MTVPDRLPLPTLLSQALVAFTVELDNEFERRLPHRTSTKRGEGPWLVSVAMWSTCLSFVDDDGVTVRRLEELARTGTNLDGMRRWGYVTIDGDVLRPTPAGRRAREIWPPLFAEIEVRWRERLGDAEIDRLRETLRPAARQLGADAPDCLPILGHGLWSTPRRPGVTPSVPEPVHVEAELPLLTLLSRTLLAFAREFEGESDISLAISANVLRVLGDEPTPIRDLPQLTGVSKEAVSMALGTLTRTDLAVVEPDPAGSRFKIARLTPEGGKAQGRYRELLAAVERRWAARLGAQELIALRESLEQVVAMPTAEPYPDGWRAAVRKPATLPHFPMVLHRGGFPDGS
jgi:DNA-binding MarR family transcriptional regulator